MAELHDLTALAAGAAIRAGNVGPVELVRHYLDRIERLDGHLGAFVRVRPEAALAQAEQAQLRLLGGGPSDPSPLFGVPTAVKDLNATAGVPTTYGSAVMADFVPDYDDFVVVKMRAAGLISLGKTATPEFGLPCYTETDVGPPARTPWDTTRLAGGSSGGAGAAVAAGLLPIAQGSDGGGSIRIPAAACGLVGLKTARGRISRGPLDGDAAGFGVAGPLARTVRDAAAFLDAVAGPMPGDAQWAAPLPPGETFLAACDQPVGRLRIGRFATSPMPADIDPDVLAAWEDTSHLLEALGHDVVDIDPPFPPEAVAMFETVWAAGAASIPIDPAREQLLRPLTRYLRERGRATSVADYLQALAGLLRLSRQGVAASAAFDAVLTPSLAQLPRPIGYFTADGDPAADFARQKRYTPFTAIYNMTGQPAISLPLAHTVRDGVELPIGVQLVGRPAGEAGLLALAAQVEAARPWGERHPHIWFD
jgi:amidase